MARKKTDDNQTGDHNSDVGGGENTPNVKADRNSVAIGGINIGGELSGEVNIASGDIAIYKGYTVEQVAEIIRQIKSQFQPKPFDGRCPYKGLEVFKEGDAEFFFGREALVEDLVQRVQASRTIFVTGPSGSGKSSLIRAGLIPALKQGADKKLHSERWLFETLKPGHEPLEELARVASSLAETLNAGEDIRTKGLTDASILAQWCEIALKDDREKRAVLFIDQFEEVFTQVSKETERLAFLHLLTRAAISTKGRVILLFAMRSDFLPNCASYPELNALLSQQFIQIGAMRPPELVSAIAQPALRVGLQIDPDLIAQIINDMQGAPGALPLMQFALKDLFDSQQAKKGVIALTLYDYNERGGIYEALERHADASFADLNPHEQELARSIFSNLIEVGRGTQDTRRTAIFHQLVPANTNAEEVQAVVQKLADARLITTEEKDSNQYTITHEKLITAWPWLERLINENRDAIALQNEITNDAKEWDDHARDPSYLYAGARLANAEEKLEANKIVLSGLAYEFVIAGQDQHQRNQRTRILGVAIPIGLVILAIVVVSYIVNANSATAAKRSQEFAITQGAAASTSDALAAIAQANEEKAQKQTTIARAGEIAALAVSQRESQLDLSLLLSVEAFRTADTVRTRTVLLDNLETNPQLIKYLRGHRGAVSTVAISPDGRILASGNEDHTILLWDVASGQLIGQPLHGNDYILRLIFSPDGKMLASGSFDGTILLWDMVNLTSISPPLRGHSDAVRSLAFSPDGTILASGSGDHTILLWDVASRKAIGNPLTGHRDSVSSLFFSSDGRTLISLDGEGEIISWNVESQHAMKRPPGMHHPNTISETISPDGKLLALASSDGTITLWDVASGKSIGEPLERKLKDSIPYLSLAFNQDGSLLALGSCEGSERFDIGAIRCVESVVTVWDVEKSKFIGGPILGQPLVGHHGSISALTFGPDGKSVVSSSDDGLIIVWSVEDRQPISQSLGEYESDVISVAFNPAGTILAVGMRSGAIDLWNITSSQLIGELFVPYGAVNSVAFSPNGKALASIDSGGTIRIWDVERQKLEGKTLVEPSGYGSVILFSPDGKMLASLGGGYEITLWDVARRIPTGQPLKAISNWSFNSIAFSPDGKTLASGSSGRIMLWDVASHRPIGQPLKRTGGYGSGIAFSPDGTMLFSGGSKGELSLWDVKSRQPIGQPLQGYSGYSVVFHPDGKKVAVASGASNNPVVLWDVDPGSWVVDACQRAGRNFTASEWAQYFPNEVYHLTCDTWPQEPEIPATPTHVPIG